MPAFQQAIQLGADGLELDVQRTADGRLVVIHDESVNRTSNGFGRIVDLTFDDLHHLDFAHGFAGRRNVRIPTLEDVLELARPTSVTVNVELKNSIVHYPGLEDDVLRVVEQFGMLDRVVISSFNHWSLANLRGRIAPEQIGILMADGIFEPWRYAAQVGAGAVHPHFAALQHEGYVWLCHEQGIKVNVWTVNDDDVAVRLAALGVDAIITDFPDRVGRAVNGPRPITPH